MAFGTRLLMKISCVCRRNQFPSQPTRNPWTWHTIRMQVHASAAAIGRSHWIKLDYMLIKLPSPPSMWVLCNHTKNSRRHQDPVRGLIQVFCPKWELKNNRCHKHRRIIYCIIHPRPPFNLLFSHYYDQLMILLLRLFSTLLCSSRDHRVNL